MLVVHAAGELDVAVCDDVAGDVVVGKGVGVQHMVVVGEHGVAGCFKEVAVPGLQIAFEHGGVRRLRRGQQGCVGNVREIGLYGGLLSAGASTRRCGMRIRHYVLIWDGSVGGFLGRYALCM